MVLHCFSHVEYITMGDMQLIYGSIHYVIIELRKNIVSI